MSSISHAQSLNATLLYHTLNFAGDVRTLARSSAVCRNWNACLSDSRACNIFQRALENDSDESVQHALVSMRNAGEPFPTTLRELKTLCQTLLPLWLNVRELTVNLVNRVSLNSLKGTPIAINAIKDYWLISDTTGCLTAIPRNGDKPISLKPELPYQNANNRIIIDIFQRIFITTSSIGFIVRSLEDFSIKCKIDLGVLEIRSLAIYNQYIFFTSKRGFCCVDYKTQEYKNLNRDPNFGPILLKDSDLFITDMESIGRYNVDELVEFFNTEDQNHKFPKALSEYRISYPYDVELRDIGKLGIRIRETNHRLKRNVLNNQNITAVISINGEESQRFSFDSNYTKIIIPPFSLGFKSSESDTYISMDHPWLHTRHKKLDINPSVHTIMPNTVHYDGYGNLFMILSKDHFQNPSFELLHYRFEKPKPSSDLGDEKASASQVQKKEPKEVGNIVSRAFSALGSVLARLSW